MFDTILCISLFGVKAKWTGIKRLASLQDGKIGNHGIVLLFLLSFCDISPLFFVYLFFLRWTIFTFLAVHNGPEWTGIEWAGLGFSGIRLDGGRTWIGWDRGCLA
jgi:hypothetical protein